MTRPTTSSNYSNPISRYPCSKYKDFWRAPHPELERSTHIDLVTGKTRQHHYEKSHNPPILHRKETLITPDHPEIETCRALTLSEEKEGLYANPRTIGFKKNWEALLQSKGLCYQNHKLVNGGIDGTGQTDPV